MPCIRHLARQTFELATGLRPTLNHHNPEIRFNRDRRLIEVNGLFRHGFMISPAVTGAAVRLAGALFAGSDILNTTKPAVCRISAPQIEAVADEVA